MFLLDSQFCSHDRLKIDRGTPQSEIKDGTPDITTMDVLTFRGVRKYMLKQCIK